MSDLNLLYEHTFSIVIESDDHETCLSISKQLKKAIDPWFFQMSNLKEIKSARKGSVLKRELQSSQTANPDDIAVFNQMIKTLISHYVTISNVNIRFNHGNIIPANNFKNIL